MIMIYRPGKLRFLYAKADFAGVSEYHGLGNFILMQGIRS